MKKVMMMAVLALAWVPAMLGQGYQPTAANLESRQWFQDAKFGMFIHWGVYSVPGDGEWYMENHHVPVAEYEKFAPQFNPANFDAAAIVGAAKAAGMKYITITSKHHDGFAMFATKQSRWNIVDATPYGKDPLAQLAAECRKQGIKLFFYYSQLDWRNPDYLPVGNTGHASGRTGEGNFPRYLDYMDAQLSELLTNYGPVGGIWFDGMWDKPEADWKLARTYALIHKLQPAAMVGSNHHHTPYEGEDFQMFEKDLPGANTAGFNQTGVSQLPLETCETINGAWGYNASDKNFKSTEELIRYLVKAAGNNANFLLNVGPRPDGTLQPEFVERLQAVGAWTAKYGETIYGTRGGPITPRSWGVSTQKGKRVYLHILDWKDEYLALPVVAGVSTARMFEGGAAVELKKVEGGMVLRLPKSGRDGVDTVVELE